MKIDLVFILIIGVFAIYYLYNTKNIEKMSNVSNDIKEGIRQVYLADVDAIRNLSEVAKKLQAGGLVNPGNLTVGGTLTSGTLAASDNISVNNGTNEGGRLRILNSLKNGKAGQTNDWSIWNMTGGYGNKLSFWRYNGNGENKGPVLDLYDDGNINAVGNLNVGSGVVSNNVILNNQDLGGPGDKTRINAQGIIFGGANNGREENSAQISAGRHEADSLCIVGMSDANKGNRKITLWAEGGAKLYGDLFVNNRNILAEINTINNKINDIYARGFFEGQKAGFRSYDVHRWLSEKNGGAEVRGHRGVWSQFNLFHQ